MTLGEELAARTGQPLAIMPRRQARTAYIGARFTADERHLLEDMARDYGTTISDLVRQLVLHALAQ